MEANANNRNRAPALLPLNEAVGVQRAVHTWLNTCTELPTGMGVSFEDLAENAAGYAMASVQSPAYAARYILGGYQGEYRFRVIARALPSDGGDMLDAVEGLAKIAGWCESADPPTLDGAVNTHIKRNTDAAAIAAYDDGCIDYAVELTFTWEVF